MAERTLSDARTPHVPLSKRIYESHYVTATDPAGGRSLWVRNTALKRPGTEAHSTVWMTWFDRELSTPVARRATSTAAITDPGSDWTLSEFGRSGPGSSVGSVEDAAWDLRWDAHAPELPYLPATWLYDRPIPRSNAAVLVPSGTLSGTLDLGDETIELDAWNVIVGHNWGAEHLDHWVWLHVGGLGDDGRGWVDLGLGRIKIGPVLTPWIAAGGVNLGDGLRRTARRGKVEHAVVSTGAAERTHVGVPLDGGRVELDITAPISSTVFWDYASAAGAGRDVRNCSIADATVTVTTGDQATSFDASGCVAIEHGEPHV